MGRTAATLATLALLAALLGGCSGPPSTTEPTSAPTDGVIVHTPAADLDEALRDELLTMLEEDQAERLEGADHGGDAPRTARLEEIILEHGWPSYSLVGEEAEDAAWAIAQHSDQDPDFQALALAHLAAAVEAEDASPGNLAYLTDRVAVGAGEPQTYGTQIGCGEDGPEPVTPIVDEEAVDERRADAGLPPLADYYAEMEEICAEDF
ncbi:DUF6624 domain-containing protein [Microbacterium sp. CFBP9034]|uniref:DUF6624 domain-containing protein n=1 Tax=Microbacterium sp. CFBP9034 TaxID=3096540 RepID=UPI002A6B533A|nr:DUF6624 domain-containing protein [Microbacterium sp. CFBP9034]MDY0910920.1 DUF6624 domain-containing protein [Microbacterium sp. CFBP9034]